MFEISLWLIFVLIAALVRGLNSFLVKVISHKELDSSSIFLIQMCIASIVLLFFIDFNKLEILYTTPIMLYTSIIGLSLFYHKKLSVLVLKDVSSTIMFISTRVFPSILLLFISIFLFGDSLTIMELVGLGVGVLTLLFLYDPTDTAKEGSNFKRGIFYLSGNIITGTLLIVFIALSISIDILYTLFLYSFFCFLFFSIESIYTKKFTFTNLKNLENIRFGALFALFFTIANYFLFLALDLGNIAIVYKIFSFEIFIPIVLSMILYKEKITIKKIVAISLAILSIVFFI